MANIYVAGTFDNQDGWDDLISRLTWYFTPYLEQIERIEICASAAQIAAAALRGPLDPAIAGHMDALKARLVPASPEKLLAQLGRVDGRKHLFLLADDRLAEDLTAEIGRFRKYGRFYRIDPERARMEGSFYLWAGVNGFCDVEAETAAFRDRFAVMAREVGMHDRAYVFGTGPSLSGFVESHDFEDSLTIIANSIVMNDEMLDKLKPKLIVAADPIFHAGCSSYAAAFRAALVRAMRKTGAWFLCPLRDVQIYATYLPADLQARIIGIPFDGKIAPPTDLTRNFALKPYPNVLTLMLLPLASTLARQIHIAGCDGRPVTENDAFWTHDKKAQFVDEMDNIKKVHPGFFAIDYNNYYFEHARDLETVLTTIETAGRRCVNECTSFIPALRAREPDGLRPPEEAPDRPFDPRCLAILDPDARGDWGHFLAYDRRVGTAVAEAGLNFAVVGRTDLAAEAQPACAQSLIRVFTRHSWTLGNKWPQVQTEDLTTFAFEFDGALNELEAATPEGDILIFMYCGSLEVVDMLEHILIYHPRVRAVINLFWSYNFDISDPAYRAQWHAGLARAAEGRGQVRVLHSTPQIAAEFAKDWDVEIGVLPHPSTTFDDAEAARLAAAPARNTPGTRRPRVLLPGGARPEKGYLIAAEACGLLAADDAFDLSLRARLDHTTPPRLRAAVEALDPDKVTLVEGDLGEEDFVDWLAGADVIVVPYLPEAFSNRTSGMLVDAMLLGIPVVVIENTWLADEVAESGAGLAVAPTAQALAAGIRQVLADYARYAAATRTAAQRYLETSTWRVLVSEVLATAGAGAGEAGAAALPPATRQSSDGPALLHNAVGSAVASAETLETLLEGSDGRACLSYADPRGLVARAIAEGADPQPVLAGWRRDMGALLALYRANRARLALVERDGLQRNTGAYRVMLSNHAIALPDDLAPAPVPVPEVMIRALAELLVLRDAETRQVLDELEASALRPLEIETEHGPDAQAVLGAFDRMKAVEGEAARLRGEMGRKASELRVQSAQIDQLRAASETYATEADTLRADSAHRAEANRKITEEAYALRAELDAVYASTSWKISGPVRSLKRVLGGGGK